MVKVKDMINKTKCFTRSNIQLIIESFQIDPITEFNVVLHNIVVGS